MRLSTLLGEKVDASGSVAPDEFAELDVSAEGAKISQEIPWGGESPSDRTANSGSIIERTMHAPWMQGSFNDRAETRRAEISSLFWVQQIKCCRSVNDETASRQPNTSRDGELTIIMVDAWGKQTVAGYAGVRMVEMAAAHGPDIARNGPAQSQSANRGDVNFRQHARTPGGGRPRNSEPARR
ncbi:hypothetical protein B0H14DRAFT_2632259 [Mycena olivaceomarginata]|nr:hypothetical protein B0H14DRAFT_2632259 [Mycena olivaceomarginata]